MRRAILRWLGARARTSFARATFTVSALASTTSATGTNPIPSSHANAASNARSTPNLFGKNPDNAAHKATSKALSRATASGDIGGPILSGCEGEASDVFMPFC